MASHNRFKPARQKNARQLQETPPAMVYAARNARAPLLLAFAAHAASVTLFTRARRHARRCSRR